MNLFPLQIIAVILFLLFNNNLYAQQSSINIPKKELSTFVNQWQIKHNIPGISLTVYSPKDGYFTTCSGYKAIHSKNKINKNTLFQVGSITKTFTAMAILQQVASGKIHLNDRIERWFPQFPRWRNITIQQLLNMTSGIFRYMNIKAFAERYSKKPSYQWEPIQLIRLAYQQEDYFKPGKAWHYSNTNYLMLGLILEKLTHQNISCYFKYHFFDKLNLRTTRYITDQYDDILLKSIAHGYFDKKDVSRYSMSAFGAAGAMLSTSNDIAHWVNSIFMGSIVPKTQLEEFKTTVPFDAPPKPKGSRYGLGVYYSSSKKYGDIWWYSGVTNGYMSLFLYLPKYQLTVAATINQITNGNFWVLMPTGDFSNKLLNLLLSSSRKK